MHDFQFLSICISLLVIGSAMMLFFRIISRDIDRLEKHLYRIEILLDKMLMEQQKASNKRHPPQPTSPPPSVLVAKSDKRKNYWWEF